MWKLILFWDIAFVSCVVLGRIKILLGHVASSIFLCVRIFSVRLAKVSDREVDV